MYICICIYVYVYIRTYTYKYTANCINFGKHKHIVKKVCIGKSVTVNVLINLNKLD